MARIEFSAVLPDAFRDDLESLLYFNPLQPRARAAIRECIERYGEPRVLAEAGFLTITVGDLSGVQTLFAVADYEDECALAGVAVYTRQHDRLIILHLAVAEEFAARRGYQTGILAVRLALVIRRIAARLKGVRTLVLSYSRRAIRLRTPGRIRRPTPVPAPVRELSSAGVTY